MNGYQQPPAIGHIRHHPMTWLPDGWRRPVLDVLIAEYKLTGN